MNRKKTFLAGLVTVLLLAAVGMIVYHFRYAIAERAGILAARLRRKSEYDDFADV